MNKPLILMAGALLVLGACKSSNNGKSDANSVTRRYSRPAPEVWSALTIGLSSLDLRIEQDKHDALGGELTAVRATQDPVRVFVKSIDETTTQVLVSVGEGERNLADIIHGQIAKNLGTGTAKSSFYGGSKWEQVYDSSLARCVVAAERAAEAIGYAITHRDIHETMAEFLARRGSSSAILMRFDAAPPAPSPAGPQPPGASGVPSDKRGQVKVSFVVGTSRTEENEEVLQRLRYEFDRLVRQ